METGNSTDLSLWMSQDTPQFLQEPDNLTTKWSSVVDLLSGRGTLGDVIRELGVDCDQQSNNLAMPYPETSGELPLSGLGPGSVYLRQTSWPVPERSPPQRLPRPASLYSNTWSGDFATSTPIFDAEVQEQPFLPAPPSFTPPPAVFSCSPPAGTLPSPSFPPLQASITEEQARVLSSLSDNVLYTLLRQMNEARRGQVCRFCKNNRERESYYRSHVLKDAAGRVACPVLRAHVCDRCGATGDRAHTIKYCPESTKAEKIKSTAMMRSVRMASGRRRHSYPQAPSVYATDNYFSFDTAPSAAAQIFDFTLDPSWAALENRLLMI